MCALVDGRDTFDPYSAQAAGVELKQLLWVRCRNIDQAFRATDLLIQGGGFGLIALDLSDIPPRDRALRSAQCLVPFPSCRGRYVHDFGRARAGAQCQDLRLLGPATRERALPLVEQRVGNSIQQIFLTHSSGMLAR